MCLITFYLQKSKEFYSNMNFLHIFRYFLIYLDIKMIRLSFKIILDIQFFNSIYLVKYVFYRATGRKIFFILAIR